VKAIRIAFILALAATPAAAQDKVKFEPKFVLNTAFFQQVTTDVKQTITVQGGSELKLTHSQTFQFKWLPVKQDGDKWILELTIEGMKLNVDIATNQVKYDSSATGAEAAGNNAALAEFFKNLTDPTTKFTVTLGKGGVVEKVDGKDEFLKKLGGANPQMEGILKKILTDESLKEMADPMHGLTTAAEKAVNDTWEKTTPIPLGPVGSYDRTLKFTYKGKEPGADAIYKVEANVSLAYKPPAADAADGLVFRIKSGDLKPINPKPGTYRFDATKGFVKDAELTVSLKGTLKVALGNNTETDVELFQVQTTKLETKDTTFKVERAPTAGPGVPPIPPKAPAPPPMPPMPPKK